MAMDTSIIRTIQYEERGMFVTAVYGLNIFVTNEQAINVDNDPRVEFMRTIGENLYKVAHIGDMALEGDDPNDYFTTETWNNQRLTTHVGLYNNAFYASQKNNGYIFFEIQRNFWRTQVDEYRNGGLIV
jgi:hypothetical protein